MNEPAFKSDLRFKDQRDAEVLARIVRDGGFSLTWLVSNRDNAASLHRLIASGSIDLTPDWWPAPAPRTWLDRVNDWLKGEKR